MDCKASLTTICSGGNRARREEGGGRRGEGGEREGETEGGGREGGTEGGGREQGRKVRKSINNEG